MELHQVRYFLALARTLNFTRAAEECNVTQPALTRSIQRLEEEFDGPLIYRERGNTQLTPLGQLMLPLLEQTYGAAEAAKAQAAMFRRQDRMVLRLGTAPEIGTGFLVPVLRELQRRLANLELSWRLDGRAALVDTLAEGTLDAAILAEPEKLPDQFHRWPLFAARYVLVCPQAHPLAGQTEIPVDMLRDAKLLIRDRADCEFRTVLHGWGLNETNTAENGHRAQSEEHIEQLVLSGLGLALSMEGRRLSPGLVARPIAAAPRNVLLVAPAGRQRTVASDAFIKLVRAQRSTPASEAGHDAAALS